MDKATITLIGYLQTAMWLMLVLPVLVAVHELGHYSFARMFGAKVDAFAVMMGGLRKTPLGDHLDRPLLDGKIVGLAWALASGVTLFAGLREQIPVYLGGLVVAGVLFPFWVMTRLAALYDMPPITAIRQMLGAIAASAAILLFAVGTKNFTIQALLGLLPFASCIALIFLYYYPVLSKDEETPQGQGHLNIRGKQREVMFRPLLCRTSKSGTEFSLLMLPLGGFATIHGMHPRDDGSEVNIERGFYSRTPFARWMILFAGPLFSVVFGVLLFGVSKSIEGKPSEKPILGELLSNSPAERAGLKAGDLVLSIDGNKVGSWYQMLSLIQRRPEQNVTFIVQRKQELLTFKFKTDRSEEKQPLVDASGKISKEQGYVGRIGATVAHEPIAFSTAMLDAVQVPMGMVVGLASVVQKPSLAKENLGGPASIAQTTHETQSRGPIAIAQLAGLLSISLGVMNLLPIPPLDGGQMLIAMVEMFRRGKRLSIEVQRTLSSVGAMLVFGLIMLMLVFDVGKFSGK